MKKLVIISLFSLCAAQKTNGQWSLSGNAVGAADFLGTTNSNPILFKANSINAGRIESYAGGSGASANTGIGGQTLQSLSTGTHNAAFGFQSLASNQTGNSNTAYGAHSLYGNILGDFNTAIGREAHLYSYDGDANVAVGYRSLYHNRMGHNNTAVGAYALLGTYDNSSYNNVAVGYEALKLNTTGSGNAASGVACLNQNTTGSYNAGYGPYAMPNTTSGSYNVAVGGFSLYYQTTGYYNTGLGISCSPYSGTLSNWTGLGSNVGGGWSASNMVEIGNSSVTSIRQQVATTVVSDSRIKENVKENVPGLDFIKRLRPVTYNLNIHKQNAMSLKNYKEANPDWEGKYDIEKITQTGFIAQEVEAAASSIGYDFSGVDKPASAEGLYGIRYVEFVMPLVKSVQELSEENSALRKELNELRAMVMEMKNGAGNSTTAAGNGAAGTNKNVTLGQNVPNPAAGNTVISVSIPAPFTTACIKVYSASGAEVGNYPVAKSGDSEITVDCRSLSAGNYVYTLSVDGKTMDSKKMILTK